MKGMKKTGREFERNDVCQMVNDVRVMSNMCMAPEIVVKESRKHYRTSKKVSVKEIVSILMMVFGIAAIICSLVECYFMTYHEFYSQYVFMNLDGAFAVLISGFIAFICGIRLALTH